MWNNYAVRGLLSELTAWEPISQIFLWTASEKDNLQSLRKNESLEQQMCATIKIWFLAELRCRELVAWFIAPQKVRLSGAKTEINNHGKPPRARSHMCTLYNGRQTSRSSGTLRGHSTACRESSRGQGRTQGRGFGLLWTNDPVAANPSTGAFSSSNLFLKVSNYSKCLFHTGGYYKIASAWIWLGKHFKTF